MKNIILYLSLLTTSQAIAFDINLQGNSKTLKSVVEIEIADLRNEELNQRTLKEIKRRLWNLRVFSSVELSKISTRELSIIVKERWTLIPVVKFSSGGGSEYKAFGIFDINAFGTNTELGAQYETLNDRPAGVAWLRKPQFLEDRNLKFGMDLWSINRVRFFFDQNGELDGAFTLKRTRVNTFIEKKWSNDFYLLGFQYDYHIDGLSDFGLGDELLESNTNNNFQPDDSSINRWHTVYFNIGRLNFENHLVNGSQLALTSSLISISDSEDSIATSNSLTFKYYKLFKRHFNFAYQLRLQGNNSDKAQYASYLGGLSEVRGYEDGQFFDRFSWQSNIEQRFNLFENKLGIVQGVFFSDQAKEGESFQNILDSKQEILLSSGLGLRFISPKIFSFVARLDYAQTHTRFINRSLAFGIQQFF